MGDWMCKRGGRGGAALGAPGTAPSKTFALRPRSGVGVRSSVAAPRRREFARYRCVAAPNTPESRPRPRYGRQSMQADASGGGAAWTSRPAQGFRGVGGEASSRQGCLASSSGRSARRQSNWRESSSDSYGSRTLRNTEVTIHSREVHLARGRHLRRSCNRKANNSPRR